MPPHRHAVGTGANARAPPATKAPAPRVPADSSLRKRLVQLQNGLSLGEGDRGRAAYRRGRLLFGLAGRRNQSAQPVWLIRRARCGTRRRWSGSLLRARGALPERRHSIVISPPLVVLPKSARNPTAVSRLLAHPGALSLDPVRSVASCAASSLPQKCWHACGFGADLGSTSIGSQGACSRRPRAQRGSPGDEARTRRSGACSVVKRPSVSARRWMDVHLWGDEPSETGKKPFFRGGVAWQAYAGCWQVAACVRDRSGVDARQRPQPCRGGSVPSAPSCPGHPVPSRSGSPHRWAQGVAFARSP